jgi:hypothetical protein
MKIFVSSTYRDLKRDRAAVADALNRLDGVKAVRMEDFFATYHPPIKECLDRLAECDAVVLLLGSRYGSLDPERGISVTEVEYCTAHDLGLPVIPFLKRKGGSWQSAEPDVAIRELHEAFKRRVEQNAYRVSYRTIPELKYEVEAAIHNYRAQHGLIGVRVPAFQSPEQFFYKFTDRSAIFNHGYPFVGRQAALERIVAFPQSPQRVLLLTGRGGIGKTRLLKEALDRMATAEQPPTIRLIREGIEFTTETAKQLPAGPVLVVADDAHRLDGLSDLLAVAQEYPQRIKPVLVARPHGLPGLRRRLVEAGFGTGDIEHLPELGELTRPEFEQLAREVLGPAYAHHADALVAASRDAPLVTVVGGRLLVEERIPLGMLASSDAFRFHIFDKLAETYTDAIPEHVDRHRARQVLVVLAALGPFRPEHEALVERAATFLGLPVHELRRYLAELERVGVVRQVGFSLRIWPDVLADFFLEEACVGVGGQPTAYADELFAAFWPVALGNLLRNLAELDWRVRQQAAGTTLLARLWHDLRELYVRLRGYDRYRVMDAVAAVAYLQPEPALDFARFVVEHLEPQAPPDAASIFVSPRDLILRKLSAILEASARLDSTIRASLDLLWQLRDEPFGEIRHHPEHPIRVLQELAGFEFEKPTWVYDTVLDRIGVWLRRGDAYRGAFSPLDVLDGMLKRDGRVTWTTRTEGLRVHWQEFEVQARGFGSYRGRGLDLLELQVAERAEPPVRLRILKSLVAAVWSSHQLAEREGREMDELDARAAENARILQIIEHLVSRVTDSMLVLLAADEVHAKVIDEPRSPREANLRAFLAAVPNDERTRLTHHLWQGSFVREIRPGPWRYHDEAIATTRAEADALVRGLRDRCQTAEAIKVELEAIVADITSYGMTAEPGPFLAQLVQAFPTIGVRLAELVIADPGSPLASGLVGLVLPLREHDPSSYKELLNRMIGSGNAALVRLGATVLSRSDRLTESETALVSAAAKHQAATDIPVTIGALRPLLRTDPAEALRLVVAIDLGNDPRHADQLCGVLFDLGEAAPTVDLPDGIVAALLGKFVALEEIGESHYHLRAFVDWLSRRDPVAVARMFLGRIQRAGELPSEVRSDYRPVPYASFLTFPTRSADPAARQAALRTVRDATAELAPTDVRTDWWFSDLFVALAGGWDETSLAVLTDWVESGEAQKIARVAQLLRQADPDFVFDHEAFTVALLHAADVAGEATLEAVDRSLHCTTSDRGGSGTPGEPMPHWIELRDRARQRRDAHPAGSAAAAFYASLEQDASWMIEHDRKSWEEEEAS